MKFSSTKNVPFYRSISAKLLTSFVSILILVVVGAVLIRSINQILETLRAEDIRKSELLLKLDTNIRRNNYHIENYKRSGNNQTLESYRQTLSLTNKIYLEYLSLIQSEEERLTSKELQKNWNTWQSNNQNIIHLTNSKLGLDTTLFQLINDSDVMIENYAKQQLSSDDNEVLRKQNILSETQNNIWKTLHILRERRETDTTLSQDKSIDLDATTTPEVANESAVNANLDTIVKQQLSQVESHWNRFSQLAVSADDQTLASSLKLILQDIKLTTALITSHHEKLMALQTEQSAIQSQFQQIIEGQLLPQIELNIQYENQTAQQMQRYAEYLSVIGLLLVLGYGWYFYKLIATRIVRLSNYSYNVTYGEQDIALTDEGKDEITQLTQNLVMMVARLNTANEEITRKAAELEKTSKHKSEFLACMSHEIRTPMNGVIGMLELIEQERLTETQLKKVRLAHTSAESLLSIINDILDFSKIEANKLDFESINFDVIELIENFCSTIAPRAFDKGLEFIVDYSQVTQTQLIGDPNRIRQVLTNLVGNAIKFTSEGEILLKISVSKQESGTYLFKCAVKDSGIGIEEEKLAHIFDSFAQEDSSMSRKFGGTGLGLTIAKNLCQQMDGDIQVASKIGIGSIFTMHLALKCEKECLLSLPNITGETKALVVDDNNLEGMTLQQQLGLIFDHVECVHTASQFEYYLTSEQLESFTHIFLDEQIQDLNYMLVINKIIKQTERDIQLNLMLKSDITPLAKSASKLGVHGIIYKPIFFNHLLSVVQNKGTEKQKLNETANNTNEAKFSSGHVLIVEDNFINQEVIKEILSNMQLTTELAENGYEAVYQLREQEGDNKFDVVLMDCQMPQMDGFQATKEIREGRAGEAIKTIPIVAMTANAMPGDEEKCLASGMDEYLTKPIDKSKLYKTLSKYITA